MKAKNTIALVLALAVSVGIFTSCKKEAPEPSGLPDGGDAGATINIASVWLGIDGSPISEGDVAGLELNAAYTNGMVTGLNPVNPGVITFSQTDVPGYDFQKVVVDGAESSDNAVTIDAEVGGAYNVTFYFAAVIENICLEKYVTASSSMEIWGWYTTALVDGARAEIEVEGEPCGWSSSIPNSSDHIEWVQIDTGAVYLANKIDIWPRTAEHQGFPIEFTIQASVDGENWTTIIDETDYPKPDKGAVQTFEFEPTALRYIMLYCTKLSNPPPNYVVQLCEFECYGMKWKQPVSDPVIFIESVWLGSDGNPLANGVVADLGLVASYTEGMAEGKNIVAVGSLTFEQWAIANCLLISVEVDGEERAPGPVTIETKPNGVYYVTFYNRTALSNILLNKPITSSSALRTAQWSLEFLVDGKTASSGGSYGWHNEPNPDNDAEWVKVDAGAIYLVNQVKIYPRSDAKTGFPVDFSIQVSLDGEHWTVVTEEAGYPAPSPGEAQTFDFRAVEARYVMLYCTSLWKNENNPENIQYQLQLAEMECYGTELSQTGPTGPMDPSENVAVGKSARASSSSGEDGWSKAAALTDGVRSSDAGGWSSVLGITPGGRGRANEWVEIDLGAIYRTDRVDLYPRNDAGHVGEGFPADFRIQVSEDQVVWADVLIEKGYAQPGDEAQIFRFSAINARYIRVVGTSLATVGTDSVMQLAEVEVHSVPLVTELATEIIMTGDDSFKLYVNGTQAAGGAAWNDAQKAGVILSSGENVIAAEVTNNGEYGGLLAQITVDGKMVAITNAMWKMSPDAPTGWNKAGFDDSGWAYATDHGPYKKYPYNVGNPEVMPGDTMARWIWGESEMDDGPQTRYFRFTINIDPVTGEITIPQPVAGKAPADRMATAAREASALWKLASGGMPETVIVRSIYEDTPVFLAATELQAYLGEMIGSKPEISQTLDNSKVNILVGTPGNATIAAILEDLGISVTEESLGYDGYLLKTTVYKGSKVVLLTGYKPRSALFAAYRLLEALGCRFYGPKTAVSDNEIVPALPDLAVTALDERHIPETKLRMMVNGSYYAGNTEVLEYMVDWGAKNGFNSILLTLRPNDPDSGTAFKDIYPDEPWEHYDYSPLTKRGFEIMYAAHNWMEFVPSGVSAAGTWYTNEENIQIFLARAVAYAKGHPEATAIGIWQPDGPRSDISAPGPVGHQNETWRFTDWNLYLMNRIAAEFKKENIKNAAGGDMRVMWMAYVEGCRPPLYNIPDDLLDLYYYHAWQNYQVPLGSEESDKPADWILDDWYRRPQNTDHVPEPVPDSLLAQRPVMVAWSNFLTNNGFKGDAVLVDHKNSGIGIELRFPAISYTNLGPVFDLEGDHRYAVEIGFNGYTNNYGHTDYSNHLTPVDADTYLQRRNVEAMWNSNGNRDTQDSDYYISYYGAKYATRIMRFFDQIYFELLADKRDYYSVKRVMGELYDVIASLTEEMLGDPDVTASQKTRIETVFNWYNRRAIPYKLQYYNVGDLRNGTVGLLY